MAMVSVLLHMNSSNASQPFYLLYALPYLLLSYRDLA